MCALRGNAKAPIKTSDKCAAVSKKETTRRPFDFRFVLSSLFFGSVTAASYLSFRRFHYRVTLKMNRSNTAGKWGRVKRLTRLNRIIKFPRIINKENPGFVIWRFFEFSAKRVLNFIAFMRVVSGNKSKGCYTNCEGR